MGEEERTIFARHVVIFLIVFTAFSPLLVRPVKATIPALNLPPLPVIIEVSNGTQSYFNTVLSNVPPAYDVTNSSYMGWCVDRRTNMARSPATHNATLYSSSNPPPFLSNQNWTDLNYLLNHKKGTAEDIQEAIWYFINFAGNYTPSTSTALAMVNDAKKNSTGFVPSIGQVLAVICYTIESNAQISVIEIKQGGDQAPPTTILMIGEPKHISDSQIYVSPETPFTLNATDDNSGVASTWLRINYSTPDSNTTILDWTRYPDNHPPFHLGRLCTLEITIYPDCNFTIEFYSIDKAGNIETTKTAFVIMLGPDIDGNNKVNMDDLETVLEAFGSFPTHPRWNLLADLNFDGKIDLRDIDIVLRYFGQQHYLVTTIIPEVFFA